MKFRTFPFLLLAGVVWPAFAAWDEVDRFDDGIRIYADPGSIRRDGDEARLRHLVRWAEPQADPGVPPYRSTVVDSVYDCVAKRQRFLSSASYAGALGDGPRVDVDQREDEAWDIVSAGSLEEKLWTLACRAATAR